MHSESGARRITTCVSALWDARSITSSARELRVRARIVQGVQRGAGEALAAEAARLSAHFDALQARIEEAKSQAAAACQPMPREAKVAASLLERQSWLAEWALFPE